MSCDFTHLHVHSEFSLLDGYASTKAIVERAGELGMGSIAITDHGVLYGAMEFFDTAKKQGIQPIIGVEAYVAPESRFKAAVKGQKSALHQLLLAQDMAGYRNLIKLTTHAHCDAPMKGLFSRPRIDWSLLEQHSEGIIATSSCIAGEVIQQLVAKDPAGARKVAGRYRDLFGPERFYLELQLHDNSPELEIFNEELVRIGRELAIPLVATGDTHFVRPEDRETQARVMAMGFNMTLDELCAKHFQMDETYAITSADDMYRRFKRYGTAPIENSVRIAEMCRGLDLKFGNVQLPAFTIPENHTVESYLRSLCEEGLWRRCGEQPPANYVERLYYELDVINRTGFPDYMLIVWDYVRFARSQGIPLLPRGSAGASLVLYSLGITDVDPIENKLLFERFLSLERLEMPDIDIDFADTKRQQVLDYIADKYGRENVAQIMTYGTLGAKQALRDMGRVLQVPHADIDRLSKLVPATPAGVTLRSAMDKVHALQTIYDEGGPLTDLMDWAMKVEGRMKSVGTHACGLVISRTPLVDMVPLQKTKDGQSMAAFEGSTLAKMGLLKMDILGLSNLAIVAEAFAFIELSAGKRMGLLDIPLDDAATFAALARGETRDVFQLESAGMTRHLMELKPTHVGDLYAMVALYRPGPLEQIPHYIASKNDPSQVTYVHPILEPILQDTYGVIVYQEQIMQLLQAIAGYTLGNAYIVLKAIGKKNKQLMASEEPKFMQGCVDNGLTADQATTLWQLIQPFAGYSFNRPHSTLYGLLAYQTAWLKNNYPTEYMAAVLSAKMDTIEELAQSAIECKRLGVQVLGPCINTSDEHFQIEPQPDGSRAIRFGLNAIRNLGGTLAQDILNVRRSGLPFLDIDDFCRRTAAAGLHKKALESLIKAGAFDRMNDNINRHQLMAMADAALQAGNAHMKRSAAGQASFFDDTTDAESVDRTIIPAAPVGAHLQREVLTWEHEMIGLYLSEHPLNTTGIRHEHSALIGSINEDMLGEIVQIVVLITKSQRIPTKQGWLLALTCEDLTGQIEVVGYSDRVEQYLELLNPNSVVRVTGEITKRRSLQILLDSVSDATEEPVRSRSKKKPRQEPHRNALRDTTTATDGAVPAQVPSVAVVPISSVAGVSTVLRAAQERRKAIATPAATHPVAHEYIPAPTGRTLQIILPDSTDAVSDRQCMYAVLHLLQSYPGGDNVQVVILDGNVPQVIQMRRLLISTSEDLLMHLDVLLGKVAVGFV